MREETRGTQGGDFPAGKVVRSDTQTPGRRGSGRQLYTGRRLRHCHAIVHMGCANTSARRAVITAASPLLPVAPGRQKSWETDKAGRAILTQCRRNRSIKAAVRLLKTHGTL